MGFVAVKVYNYTIKKEACGDRYRINGGEKVTILMKGRFADNDQPVRLIYK